MTKRNYMDNVMSALRTFGTEYHASTTGFDPHIPTWKMEDKYDDCEEIEFSPRGENAQLKAFLEEGGWNAPAGEAWADLDESKVIIILERMRWPTDEEIEHFIGWCGANTLAEAEANYGSCPCPRWKLKVIVRREHDLEDFLRFVCPYVWAHRA